MKAFFFSVVLFSAFACSCSAKTQSDDLEKEAAVTLVKNYINFMGVYPLGGNHSAEKYLHPDSDLLGEDDINYVVVTKKYTVKKVVEKKENIDNVHPKDEKIVEVTVEFEKIGQFNEKEFITKIEPYERTFYCSKSNGKYMILDDSHSANMLCFYDAAIEWLSRLSEKDNSWSKPLSSLKSAKRGRKDEN